MDSIPSVENPMRTSAQLPHVIHLLGASLPNQRLGAKFRETVNCSDYPPDTRQVTGASQSTNVLCDWTASIRSYVSVDGIHD